MSAYSVIFLYVPIKFLFTDCSPPLGTPGTSRLSLGGRVEMTFCRDERELMSTEWLVEVWARDRATRFVLFHLGSK